jgi:uncharacterized RDD family membrane protein YckC
LTDMVECSVCKRGFPEDQVAQMGDFRVCSECKPIFLQGLREGLSIAGDTRYGGFWVRFVAVCIDAIVISAGSVVLSVLLSFALGAAGGIWTGVASLFQLVYYILGIVYVTYFLGAYGATLGKMVFGLRVVKPNGDKITYGRAFGRYWASALSGLILSIGYIIAAFDDEKRSLHDRICETRVIRT